LTIKATQKQKGFAIALNVDLNLRNNHENWDIRADKIRKANVRERVLQR
jgi:hypothetical protein